MKIKWQGYLGNNHSWSIVAQNISRRLIMAGHDVDLISTNGLNHLPPDLMSNVKESPDSNYDMQLTYSAMKNFPYMMNKGTTNRFGIWCYEFAGLNSLPAGFAKYYKSCDLLLPPSEFAKRVFLESGIPDTHIRVVPHGINAINFSKIKPLEINVPQKIKILVNIAQPHIRKNIKGVFDAYGKAFSKKDDVALILKTSFKKPEAGFEVSFEKEFSIFRYKYPNHAPVKVIKDFIPNMESLYNACNVTFSMAHAECFHMPSLEGLAAGHIVLAPKYGGQLDFLNEQNSLLIDGKEINAPPQALYYQIRTGTKYFEPFLDSAVSKLRYMYDNFDVLKQSSELKVASVHQTYDWSKIADQILSFAV